MFNGIIKHEWLVRCFGGSDSGMNDNKRIWRNIGVTALVAGASYALSIAVESFYTSSENILLVFVISLLFIVIFTKSYITGIIVAAVEMAVFNIYFVAPRGSILSRNIPSFILFFTAAIIIGKVVTNLQQRTEKEMADSIVSKNLYRVSRGLINVSGVDNIIKYSETRLSEIIDKKVKVYWGKEKCEENEAAKFCFENKKICGWGHQDFTFADSQYFPIPDDQNVRGVVCIPGSMDEFSTEAKAYTRTFFSLVTMAIQREDLRQAEEEARVDAEREKFKSDLLHSVSHDLRTPLTVISGGAEFLCENLDYVDKDTVHTMLEDIVSDSEWLSSMVENLLNMTRIQEGKLVMNLKKELVEDIVSGAAERVKKSIKDHTLRIENSEEMLFVKVDGQLITKVIINLLDNAFCAASKCSAGKVNVSIKTITNNLMVTINNNIAEPVRMKNKKFITSKMDKKNHGIGTMNVNEGVNSYSGKNEYNFTDKDFTVDVILPNVIHT